MTVAAWHKLRALCESPIEEALCDAFAHRWYRRAEPAFGVCTPERMRAAELCRLRLVFAQYPIERFRADFLVVEGFAPPLVIECDGHAFHQGDPSTWERDAERDATIRRVGFQTVHFTGSRILSQIDEVLDIVERALAGKFSDPISLKDG